MAPKRSAKVTGVVTEAPTDHRRGASRASGRQSDAALDNVDAAALGASIRALRHDHGYRLTDLSDMTALSMSFISQLERGLTNPSLGSLVRLADALGTTSHELLAQVAPQNGNRTNVAYQDANDGALITNSGGYARSLVKGQRIIQPLEMVGGPRTMPAWAVHDSDEFMYVCEGTVEVEIEAHGVFRLESGATIYCNAGIRHRWRQLGDEQLRMVLVLAPRPDGSHPAASDNAGYGSHM